MTTLRIGIASYEEMKARTMAIARGKRRVSSDEPKVWFTSTESFAVLSAGNRELLRVIAEKAPGSRDHKVSSEQLKIFEDMSNALAKRPDLLKTPYFGYLFELAIERVEKERANSTPQTRMPKLPPARTRRVKR
ncbi:MAG: transcriptional regulator [Xanthobacteraceae bacterium]